MALYASDGSINLTVVSGSSFTGVYANDGSYNVVVSPGTYVGAYHPCGALYVTVAVSPTTGALPIRAPDGSLYVSVSPYTNGGQKVTVVSGSLTPGTSSLILLSNGTSHLLLVDGVSKLKRA